MKTLLMLSALSLLSFNVLAQFKGAPSYSISGSGPTLSCRVGSYEIIDSGPLPGQRNAGRQLCADLGLLSRPSGTSQTSIGTYFIFTGEPASTCALRTAGAAAGSVTCQSSYTGQ